MDKILAIDKKGRITYCFYGCTKCEHISHQEENEDFFDFVNRSYIELEDLIYKTKHPKMYIFKTKINKLLEIVENYINKLDIFRIEK